MTILLPLFPSHTSEVPVQRRLALLTVAYDLVVTLQQLAEIEEMIVYKETRNQQTKQHILKLWTKRLNGVQRTVGTWQRILAVRSLAIRLVGAAFVLNF